jgi:RimJ/RimL family protein N-acetyltransferase
MTTVVDLPVTPVRPEDAAALIDLFHRSSESTRRERFHGTLRGFPPCYLDDIVHGRHAVVARVVRDLAGDASGGCIVALASASPETCCRAELAAWVVDGWQGKGIGTRVVRAVLEQLRTDGIATAVAYVEAANHAASALARRVAHDMGVTATSGPVITFHLQPARGELTA